MHLFFLLFLFSFIFFYFFYYIKSVLLQLKMTFCKNSFFPSVIIEWNALDPNIWNCTCLTMFKKLILKFIRPDTNTLFNKHDAQCTKHLARLRLGLSPLNDNNIHHCFKDYMNLICISWHDIETTTHFLHYYPH